jgi:hypothetical protein
MTPPLVVHNLRLGLTCATNYSFIETTRTACGISVRLPGNKKRAAKSDARNFPTRYTGMLVQMNPIAVLGEQAIRHLAPPPRKSSQHLKEDYD